jgi:hypothetical protein
MGGDFFDYYLKGSITLAFDTKVRIKAANR